MIIRGDCKDVLPTLERKTFRCCVTSPPYYHLRDYGIPTSNWPEISSTFRMNFLETLE